MSANLSICIIDDDEINRFTLSKQVERAKISDETHLFCGAKEALNFLQNQIQNKARLPDLIFLDVVMPVMDGWQFLEEYKKLTALISKKILIYIISSSTNSLDINRAKKIKEVRDYIIKPITPTLLKKIAETEIIS